MYTLKLIKEYKRYPDYKDSGVEWIGEIPKEWSSTPLFNVASENREKNLALQCSNLLSLSYGKLIEKNINNIGGLLPSSFSTYQIVHKGMIVMRLTDLQNDKRSLRVGYVTQDEPSIITSAYLGLRFNHTMNTKYLYYLMYAYDLMKVYYGFGGGVRQSLDFWNLRHIPLLIPPSPTQDTIVDFLDEKTALIDAIIEKKKKHLELLRKKCDTIINHTVTRGVDPNAKLVASDIKWLDQIPEGWKVKKIKHTIKSVNSGIWGKESKGDENDIKCLRVADFDYGRLGYGVVSTVRNNANLARQRVLQKDDLLIERSGGGEKTPVGRVIEFDGTERMTCANFIDIIRVNQKFVLPSFLAMYFYTLFNNGVVRKYIKQTTGIQNLDVKAYFTELVALPPIPEQKPIIEYVHTIIASQQEAESKIQESINKLQQFKSALISNVVTGKVKI